MNSQNIHQRDEETALRKNEIFNSLNIFFTVFKSNATSIQLNKEFLSTIEDIDSSEGILVVLENLKSIYEKAIKFIEKETAITGFGEDLLKLQRNLYIELEYLLSFEKYDPRHHFLIVIPVADRPLLLKNCLESLTEQCRIFQYGGFTINADSISVYNKVSVFIIDDSKDKSNINKIKEISSEIRLSGIQTYYIGLDEQTEFLKQLPSEYKEKLSRLIGEFKDSILPHKGASITRNIAYLYIHAILNGKIIHTENSPRYESIPTSPPLLKNPPLPTGQAGSPPFTKGGMGGLPKNRFLNEKTLIYFIDSDEEFRIKIKRSNSIEDIPFINYFYWLDKIFESSDVEVLTGKVVGDPPVSPSVMINTFLDDLISFFDAISSFDMFERCGFHEARQTEVFSAEYHDMVKLFGYKGPSSPKKYICNLTGIHTIKDCFEDFSNRAICFFYGLHPTRTQFYNYTGDFTKTENARTVYTGNYVFNGKGFRHFIPFANLKLRMAGPTLGRILKVRLKDRFVSANLPLLHKRTIPVKYIDEFRSGIFTSKDTIDLSGEFCRQFWGDVMLFSIDALTDSGYPNRVLELQKIAETVNEIQKNLWNLYREQQTKAIEKILRLRYYLSGPSYWWNKQAVMKDSVNPAPRVETRGFLEKKTSNTPLHPRLAARQARFEKRGIMWCGVNNFNLFCSLVESNFGMNSVSLKNLAEQIREGSYTNMIINAIHSFYEDEYFWNELLKTYLTAPKPTFNFS